MLRTVLAQLRNQWMGAIALILVLAGGTAYAANTVFSSDIVNNQVFPVDVRDDTLPGGGLTAADLAAGAVQTSEIGNNQIRSADVRDDTLNAGGLTAADLRAEAVGTSEVANDTSAGGGLAASDLRVGSVGSSEVADGSIQDGDLAASARGARAFGLVLGQTGCGEPVAFCTILRGKAVAYAAHVAEGKFCIGVNGINATDPTSLPIVNPAFTAVDTWVYWRGAIGGNSACAANEFEIYTGQPGTGFADNNFTILIP